MFEMYLLLDFDMKVFDLKLDMKSIWNGVENVLMENFECLLLCLKPFDP